MRHRLATMVTVPGVLMEANAGQARPAPLARILLLEDHEPSQEALRRLLTSRGWRVICAGSLEEARAALQVQEVDLLISDIGLPDGDGFAFMREFRRDYGRPGIALTSYGSEGDLARGSKAGFAFYFIKPVRFEELERAVWQLIPRQRPDSPG